MPSLPRAAAVLAAAFATLGAPSIAGAETIHVTTTADGTEPCTPFHCTLRAAVMLANAQPGTDTIPLEARTYVIEETAKRESRLTITDDLVVEGAGADVTALSGKRRVPLLRVGTSKGARVHVTLSNLGLVDASAPSTGSGAALLVYRGGDVLLLDSVVRGNSSGTYGGAIRNLGNTTIVRTTLSGNRVPENRGAAGVTANGGAIFNDRTGVMTLRESLVAGNGATRAGGIDNAGRLRIENSTISGNRTSNGGGAGIRNSGHAPAEGVLEISSSTITDNRARRDRSMRSGPGGAGLQNRSNGSVHLTNSILAGNVDVERSNYDADYSPDCYSAEAYGVASEGGNVLGVVNAQCPVHHRGRNLTGTNKSPLDPQLAPLAPAGGPTASHALTPVSRAIDLAAGCPAIDQREQPRPIDGDLDGRAACDAGAFEYQPPGDGDGVPAATEDAAPHGGDGNQDGIPDRLQPGVASVRSAVDSRRFLTLEAAEPSRFHSVTPSRPPAGAPAGTAFPLGLVDFAVDADPGASVTMFLPAGSNARRYFNYGPTVDRRTAHWYAFDYSSTSGTGAFVAPERVYLFLGDDSRGDHFLGTLDGFVRSRGGPSSR